MTKKMLACILCVVLFLGGACEKDVLENYRKNYTGEFQFTTIREDFSRIPSVIIDTVFYTGNIEAVYSNRNDLITIEFLPGNPLTAIINSSNSLSLPQTGSPGGIETIDGFFTDAYRRVVFHYRISSGNNYSVNHRVEGLRQ